MQTNMVGTKTPKKHVFWCFYPNHVEGGLTASVVDSVFNLTCLHVSNMISNRAAEIEKIAHKMNCQMKRDSESSQWDGWPIANLRLWLKLDNYSAEQSD